MICCGKRSLVALAVLAAAGCSSSSTAPSSSATASIPQDPAARTAYEFLDAVVKGDTARAGGLLTPLAMERIKTSGKPFELPGLASYTFQVGEVRFPADDKAFVQCMGTDRTVDGKTVDEEFCWLLSRVDDQWRVAGISYAVGPQKTLMIYSFENPERGAIPVQQLMAQAANNGAAAHGQPPQTAQLPAVTAPSAPRTAHEATPAAAYR